MLSELYLIGAKVVLTTASPLQPLLDRPGMAHNFCNEQAIKILQNDGYLRDAKIIKNFSNEINKGVQWIDEGWRCIFHYYCPDSGKGLWGLPSALYELNRYYRLALDFWKQGSKKKAFFYLGATVHLVQDLCVPHHALAKVTTGHKAYEDWVQNRYSNYSVSSNGIYNCGISPGDWLHQNAVISSTLINLVKDYNSESCYDLVTSILLPRAQRSTAGIFHLFLQEVLT